jgi:hypothetical protein
MPYTIEFKPSLDEKIRRAAKELGPGKASIRFWKDLKAMLAWLAENPTEIGELCFVYKQSNFQSRQAIRGSFGFQFAVNEQHQLISMQKLRLCANHTYPTLLDEILGED